MAIGTPDYRDTGLEFGEGLPLRIRHRVVPDRGRRARGRARPVDLGHLQPHSGQGLERRHRRHRLRPLPPPRRRPRPHGRPRPRGLPVLDRLAAHPAHRPGRGQRRRASRSTSASSTGCSPAASARSRRSTTGTCRRRSRTRAAGRTAPPPYAFADYARIVGEGSATASRSGRRSTSRGAAPYLGYGSGAHAPGLMDGAEALAAVHHLNLAHGLAVAALRGVVDERPRLLDHPEPPRDPARRGRGAEAARRIDGLANRVLPRTAAATAYPAD